jgi:hypothetical protein
MDDGELAVMTGDGRTPTFAELQDHAALLCAGNRGGTVADGAAESTARAPGAAACAHDFLRAAPTGTARRAGGGSTAPGEGDCGAGTRAGGGAA